MQIKTKKAVEGSISFYRPPILVLSDSGEDLSQHIAAIDVRIRPDEIVSAAMTVYPSDIDFDWVEIIKLSIINPVTGDPQEVKQIQFKDGTIWEAK